MILVFTLKVLVYTSVNCGFSSFTFLKIPLLIRTQFLEWVLLIMQLRFSKKSNLKVKK